MLRSNTPTNNRENLVMTSSHNITLSTPPLSLPEQELPLLHSPDDDNNNNNNNKEVCLVLEELDISDLNKDEKLVSLDKIYTDAPKVHVAYSASDPLDILKQEQLDQSPKLTVGPLTTDAQPPTRRG